MTPDTLDETTLRAVTARALEAMAAHLRDRSVEARDALAAAAADFEAVVPAFMDSTIPEEIMGDFAPTWRTIVAGPADLPQVEDLPALDGEAPADLDGEALADLAGDALADLDGDALADLEALADALLQRQPSDLAPGGRARIRGEYADALGAAIDEGEREAARIILAAIAEQLDVDARDALALPDDLDVYELHSAETAADVVEAARGLCAEC